MREEKSVLAINYVSHAAGDFSGALANPHHLPPTLGFPFILVDTVVGWPITACDLDDKTNP